MDLKFPHHENEIAQTCAACDSQFVNVWMHNGFVRVDDEKMSKSLGNFFTVREVLEWVRDPEVVRYLMVNSQYRGPINYSPESLAQADAALERLYLALRGIPLPAVGGASPLPLAGEVARSAGEGSASARFQAAMDDDFNTPVAVAELQTLAREVNTAKAAGDLGKASQGAAELKMLAARLGLLGLEPDVFLRKVAKKQPERVAKQVAHTIVPVVTLGMSLTDADIDRLIDERAAARKAKNFKESDRIRDVLAGSGILLEDLPGGKTLWRRG
jgi:cysteinyl-tRNA synthetase